MKQWALIVNGSVSTVVEQWKASRTSGFLGRMHGIAIGPGNTWSGSVFSAIGRKHLHQDRNHCLLGAVHGQREMIAYDVAMQHDPAASTNAKNTSAKLRVFRRMASDDGFVRLGDSRCSHVRRRP